MIVIHTRAAILTIYTGRKGDRTWCFVSFNASNNSDSARETRGKRIINRELITIVRSLDGLQFYIEVTTSEVQKFLY